MNKPSEPMKESWFMGAWEQFMDSTKTTWVRPDVRGGLFAECWQYHGDDVWFWSVPSVDDDVGDAKSLFAAKERCDEALRSSGYELPAKDES